MSTYPSATSPESVLNGLSLSPQQRALMRWMGDRGSLSLRAIATHLEQPVDRVRALLAELIQQGLIQVVGEDTYAACLSSPGDWPPAAAGESAAGEWAALHTVSPASPLGTSPAPQLIPAAGAIAPTASPMARLVPPGHPDRPARPGRGRWWAILAGVGLLGTVGGVLFWAGGRNPTQAEILDFFAEDAEYAAVKEESVELGWKVTHRDRLAALQIIGYDPAGRQVSGPLTFDLTQGLPEALRPLCVESGPVLECRRVPTDARQAGEYRFELSLIPKQDATTAPITANTSLVTVQEVPLPRVAELVSGQSIYSEGGTPTAARPNGIPAVMEKGVTLSWVVTHPGNLQDLLLIVRREDGSVLGGRRYLFRDPKDPTKLVIPEGLKEVCQLQAALICQNVPTGIRDVGKYTFELSAVPWGQGEVAPAVKKTELVQIQPRPVSITAFQINGQDARPRYAIPVDQGQPLPGIMLSWKVEGGRTARAELLPSPGSVPLQGSVPFPLNPNGEETTFTLRVSDGHNPPISRSVTITTFDPTPTDPAAAAAAQSAQEATAAAQAAAAAAARANRTGETPNAATPDALEAPSTTNPEQLSPAETPPQFE